MNIEAVEDMKTSRNENDWLNWKVRATNAEKIEPSWKSTETVIRLERFEWNNSNDTSLVPVEISKSQILKPFSAEGDKCAENGLCLRCRKNRRIGKDCPKEKMKTDKVK